jgi:hypothetical protein
VEVHRGRDLGAREPNVLGPDRYLLLGRVANMACSKISAPHS